jgi:diguanylate cyclase (GGDEF)-like protein
LDGFRHVNLTHGQHTGDLLLRRVADNLGGARRSADLVARIGGDEFAVVFTRVATEDAARRVLDRLSAEVAGPFLVGGDHHHLVATFGVVLAEPGRGSDAGRTLVRRADLTMQRAKDAGLRSALFHELVLPAPVPGPADPHHRPRWNTSAAERRGRADDRLGASSPAASPMSTAPT